MTVGVDDSRLDSLRRESYRIAIVGCGPRGLYCLDSLSQELVRRQSGRYGTHFVEEQRFRDEGDLPNSEMPRRLEIVIFEPSPHPGAGVVYALDQPRHLRMNFATQFIDAWIDDPHRSPEQLNLTNWLALRYPEYGSPQGYAPRSIVGEYLHDCFQHVLRRTTQFADVVHRQEQVTDITRVGQGWRVRTANEVMDVDEVVLAIGHEGWHCSQSAIKPLANQQYIASVFPVREKLSPERVPRGCSVAVRGFGLTWIDAALSLTEGRGGRFEASGNGFIYHASGDEPRVLCPFSRTGRPMLAKPIRSRLDIPRQVDEIWETGRKLLGTLPKPVCKTRFHADILRPILNAAERVLDTMESEGNVQVWWDDWRTNAFTPRRALDEIQRSIAVAHGESPPTPAWALAEAWRHLYPALIELVSHGGLTEDAWEEFQPVATEMERIAYGPPAENLARIVALIEAGIVDLQYVASPNGMQNQDDFDVIINAVIPAANAPAPNGPLSKLLDNSEIRPLNRFTGIEIDSAGCPQSKTGETPPRLAIFGRTTEGCVLGNDTLSRRMHPHIENWAAKTVATLTSDL